MSAGDHTTTQAAGRKVAPITIEPEFECPRANVTVREPDTTTAISPDRVLDEVQPRWTGGQTETSRDSGEGRVDAQQHLGDLVARSRALSQSSADLSGDGGAGFTAEYVGSVDPGHFLQLANLVHPGNVCESPTAQEASILFLSEQDIAASNSLAAGTDSVKVKLESVCEQDIAGKAKGSCAEIESVETCSGKIKQVKKTNGGKMRGSDKGENDLSETSAVLGEQKSGRKTTAKEQGSLTENGGGTREKKTQKWKEHKKPWTKKIRKFLRRDPKLTNCLVALKPCDTWDSDFDKTLRVLAEQGLPVYVQEDVYDGELIIKTENSPSPVFQRRRSKKAKPMDLKVSICGLLFSFVD